MNIKRLLFLILFISQTAFAQEINRYVVFFKDKEGTNFSIDKPKEFLTERSIARRIAQAIPVTQQDLPLSETYIARVKAAGIKVHYQSRWLNAVLVQDEVEKVLALSSLPFVADIKYVAPGARLNARGAMGSSTTNNAVPQTQLEMLGIPPMHEQGFTGAGKMLAVFDDGFAGVATGSKFDHLYRNNQIKQVKDFVGKAEDVYRYDDHGTKAFSTIAAVDSGTFIGVAPNAHFLLAVTEDYTTEYIIEEYNWLFAAEWADSLGTDIISTSLGYSTFDDPSMNHTLADMDGKSTVISRAANWATERGILIVTSSGNSRANSWGTINAPADAPNTLAVGAVKADGLLAAFSSGGPTADGRIKPDVVAQGQGTVVVRASGAYQLTSGTSFSAPQIAGFAAAVWEAYPQLSNLEIRELIIKAGDRYQSPDNDYGYGLPNFQRVQQIQQENAKQIFKIYPNPLKASDQWLKLKINGKYAVAPTLHIVDALGRSVSSHLLLQQPKGDYEIDVSSLAPGWYHLKLVTEIGSSNLKFIRL